MFEQDRLQGRINQLYERIEVQLRQVIKERKIREGSAFYMMKHYSLHNCLRFVKVC